MPDERVTSRGSLLLAVARFTAQPVDEAMTVATLRRGQIICRRDAPITHFVFPLDAVISLVSRDSSGNGIETGVIGREGCAGIEAILGNELALADAIVQMPGEAASVPVRVLREAAAAHPTLQQALLGFLGTLIGQLMQSAACNRLHGVEARCCRWLLAVRDRAGRNDLPLTHEFLAEMLGVRRPTVTLVLQSLQQAGLVNGARGRLVVLDREGLVRTACDCHTIMTRLLNQAGLALTMTEQPSPTAIACSE